MAAPPFLELDETRPLGIDLRPQVVALGPVGVGRIQVLEILDQHAAVELAVAEVARERGHPAAAGQAAGVAHRVLALDAGPVGQRRAGDDDRAEQLGPDRRHQQHGPAALAVADDAGSAFGPGVAIRYLSQAKKHHKKCATYCSSGLLSKRCFGAPAPHPERFRQWKRLPELGVQIDVPFGEVNHRSPALACPPATSEATSLVLAEQRGDGVAQRTGSPGGTRRASTPSVATLR